MGIALSNRMYLDVAHGTEFTDWSSNETSALPRPLKRCQSYHDPAESSVRLYFSLGTVASGIALDKTRHETRLEMASASEHRYRHREKLRGGWFDYNIVY